MANYDEELGGGQEYAEEKDKTVREQFRQLAIEALKRKKFAEAKEVLRRKVRIAELRRRQARAAAQKLTKPAADKAKQMALQIARQAIMMAARFAAQIIAAVIGAFGFYILIALLIIVIIVIVIAALKYVCEETTVGWAICKLGEGILWIKHVVGM